MTAGGLEARYRRLLRSYPPSYRSRHEDEILGVLLAAAQPGQRRPGGRESLDLLWSALRIRTRMILRGADSEPWADAREAVCLARAESRRLEAAGRPRHGAVGRAHTVWHLRTAADSIK